MERGPERRVLSRREIDREVIAELNETIRIMQARIDVLEQAQDREAKTIARMLYPPSHVKVL